MKPRDVEKYLRRGRLLPVEPALLPSQLRDFVIIPACDECESIGETLASLAAAETVEKVAILLVVNHPSGAPESVRNANRQLLEMLRGGEFGSLNLYWIDAPDLTDGVGEARKLGADAVVAALAAEQLPDTLFYSLDADTTVPPDYFRRIRAAFGDAAALTLGVRHRKGENAALERAIREYEAYMDRYVGRLRAAGSPYAFHTIGSAFVVRAEAYLRAGGMRKRSGGEDFYFLQAVSKTGKVLEHEEIQVFPSPRPSARVPFGTGPSVRKLLDGGTLDEIPDAPFALLGEVLHNATTENLIDPVCFLDGLRPELADFFIRDHFDVDWPRVVNNTPEVKRVVAFHCWFDGLRTLRFLHYCQAL